MPLPTSSKRKLVLILALLPAAAWAQDTPAPAAQPENRPAADAEQSANQSTTLQTVRVNAPRRSLRSESQNNYTVSALRSTTGLILTPKEIPQSVSVITKSQIDDQGITTVDNALKTATGVNVFKSGGRTHFMSRGYYIEQFEEDGMAAQIGSPGGFGLGGPQGDPVSPTSLAMYDHIEVVRGAAGLTQANSEPGGTVNAVRKKPTSERQISASVQADRWGKTTGTADLSGTLSEAAGLRGRAVIGLGNSRTFKEHSHGRDIMLYGVMDKTIGDNGRLTWGVGRIDQTHTPDPEGLPLWADGSGLPYKRYLGAAWNKAALKKTNLFAEYEHYISDNWKFDSKFDWRKSRSTQAYYTLNAPRGGIGANGTVQQGSFDRYDTESRQYTLQSNLTGRIFAFGRSHDLFLTHTYSQEHYRSTNRWPNGSSRFNIHTFTGHEVPQPDWNSPALSARGGEGRYKTHALALGARINPADRLHLILGGRYTRWYRYLVWDRNLKDRTPGTVYEIKRHRFIPYAGITFDLTPNHSLYASYSAIFKQTMNRDADDRLLAPISGKNYEIGWKGQWHGGKLNASAALYQTDKDNNNQRVSLPGRDSYWVSLDQRSRGLDAEISGSLTERWKIFAGYTFNRSTNRNGIPGNAASRQAGYNFSPQTPKHMFRLYTAYTLPLDKDRWTVGLGVSSQSKTYGSDGLKQGGYTLWNANLQYRPAENIQLSLAVNNLTNKRYYENQGARSPAYYNFYGEPRTITVGFKWKMK